MVEEYQDDDLARASGIVIALPDDRVLLWIQLESMLSALLLSSLSKLSDSHPALLSSLLWNKPFCF